MQMNKRTLSVVGVTALSFFLFMGIYGLLLRYDYRQERESYTYIAQNEVENIVTTIDCVMARTNTLKTLVQDHKGDTSFFDGVAESIYESVREETGVSLKNVALAPGGVVSNVYPLAGNESLIGFNFMDASKEGNPEAIEAYEKGQTILSNPFHLVQGGMGMAGRAPVMVEDEDGEALWGLVTVTIDYENLIDVLKLDNFTGMGINYELAYIDGEGNKNVMKSEGDVSSNPVVTRFAVRNLTWELSIVPSRGWFLPSRVALITALLLAVSVLTGQLANVMLKLRDSNENLRHLSNIDKLTGFFNRRAYEDDLLRYPDVPVEQNFVYASIDVNGLKEINDSLGHAAGDELLRAAAECLEKVYGGYGRLYRTGGDEFAVMFFADAEHLEKLREDIQDCMSVWSGDSVKNLSMSIGCVTKKEFPDSTVSEMAEIADKRMYADKAKYYENRGTDRRTQQAAYRALFESCSKILEVNLTEDTFDIIKADREELTQEKGYHKKLSEWLRGFAASGQVCEEDVAGYMKKTELDLLRSHFRTSGDTYVLRYRRKSSEGFKNVMMEMIPTNDYADENQKLYLFVKTIQEAADGQDC